MKVELKLDETDDEFWRWLAFILRPRWGPCGERFSNVDYKINKIVNLYLKPLMSACHTFFYFRIFELIAILCRASSLSTRREFEKLGIPTAALENG